MSIRRNTFTILTVILCCIAIDHLIASTYTFYPVADTFISSTTSGSSAQMNQNYGSNTYLRIQNPTSFSHVMLKFSQSDLLTTLRGKKINSATLQVYIETNFNNWGIGGSYVDAHQISYDWDELAATWNCDVDSNTANTSADCADLWTGGFYEPYITDSVLHQNSQTGWKSFNVTSDVQIMINDEEHYGWLLRKRNSTDGGSVDYTSIQGNSILKPKLVVITDDIQSSCTATFITSVSPGVAPSNGTSQQITVSGQNLDHITLVKIDNSSISYTLVNSQTITFNVSYSSTGTHEIWFRSDCLSDPLTVYYLTADSTSFASGDAAQVMYTAESFFSRSGKFLNWRDTAARLIGYSGDYSLGTWDFKWDSSSESTSISDFLEAGQFKAETGNPPDANTSKGFDFLRIIAMGGSCNTQKGPESPGCVGFLNHAETMPFCCRTGTTKADACAEGSCNSGDYRIKLMTKDGSWLRPEWKRRIKNLIKYADRNGIAVMIDLFDENTMSKNSWWLNNPWKDSNNDFTCTLSNAFPEFYQICTDKSSLNNCDGSLTCIGIREKKYVRSVVSSVKNTKKCGPNGDTRCRNVLFEVMNEAAFDKDWGISKTDFRLWHDMVAKWVKQTGKGYLVSATVKPTTGDDACETNSSNDWCLLDNCGSSGCSDEGSYPNIYEAYFADSIDIVSLHYPSWQHYDICTSYNYAKYISKPVIFDTDGADSANENDDIEKWAQNVGYGVPDSCGQTTGKIHFYQSKDGALLRADEDPYPGLTCPGNDDTNNDGCYYPSGCFADDAPDVDCEAWNGLADGKPTRFCRTGGAPAEVTPCENRDKYCEYKDDIYPNGDDLKCQQDVHN